MSTITWHSSVNHHLAQDTQVAANLPNLALVDQGPGSARPAARVLAALRAASAHLWLQAPTVSLRLKLPPPRGQCRIASASEERPLVLRPGTTTDREPEVTQ